MAQAARQRDSTTPSMTHAAAVGWVGVCGYLYYGEHAQLACHFASVVPPAFFSYLLIIDKKTTNEGMRSLLFFWFLQGLLLCLDTMMGEVKGYYFGKFLLLSGMFWKAAKDNNYGFGKGNKTVLRSCGVATTKEGAAITTPSSEIFDNDWPTDITQGAISAQARRLFDSEAIALVGEVSTAVSPISGLPTALSVALPTEQTATDRDFEAMSTKTCSSFRSSTPLGLRMYRDTLAAHDAPLLSSGRAVADKNPLPGPLHDMTSSHLPYGKANDDFSCGDAPLAGDWQSVAVGRHDLRTDPTGFIVFIDRLYRPQTKVHLKVQNTTNKAAMFGLKCNALERIKATPTAGVIPAGETIPIHLSLNDLVKWTSLVCERSDKLAIDYHLCDPSIAQFDKFAFFDERNVKYRVKFNPPPFSLPNPLDLFTPPPPLQQPQPAFAHTQPPVSSVTVSRPRSALSPNQKLDSCCRKQRVNPICQNLCNFDSFNDKTLVGAFLTGQCPGDQMGKAFDCASTKADHNECCVRGGLGSFLGGKCLPFCNTHKDTPANVLDYLPCLQVFRVIRDCFQEYQRVNPNIFGD